VDFCDAELGGNRIILSERHRAGRDRLPSAVACRDSSATFPGNPTTRFSARMRNLDPRHRTLVFNKRRDLGQFLDVFIFPDAQITRRDPAPRFNRRRFREN
jgi:hypothetical protein